MPDEEAPDAPRGNPLRHVEAAQQVTEDTARRLISMLEGSAPIKRIRASQVFSAVLATLGLALVLTGIEIVVQNTSYLDNGWGAILLGMGLLFASGLLLQKLIKGE
jgi:hypothetical protein